MAAVALLDVNVLVALFDAEHVHHDAAHDWFSAARRDGFATTPFTENGAIRILSNPAYHSGALTATTTREHVRRLRDLEGYTFWPATISLLDEGVLARHATLTHRQLTDLYLLALAVRYDGCLATFDASIPLAAVHGATDRHLLLLGS